MNIMVLSQRLEKELAGQPFFNSVVQELISLGFRRLRFAI